MDQQTPTDPTIAGLAPEPLACLYCEVPRGEIHSALCLGRWGAPWLWKVKGAAIPADLIEGAKACAGLERLAPDATGLDAIREELGEIERLRADLLSALAVSPDATATVAISAWRERKDKRDRDRAVLAAASARPWARGNGGTRDDLDRVYPFGPREWSTTIEAKSEANAAAIETAVNQIEPYITKAEELERELAHAMREIERLRGATLTEDEARRWGERIVHRASHDVADVGWALHAASRGDIPAAVRPIEGETCSDVRPEPAKEGGQ